MFLITVALAASLACIALIGFVFTASAGRIIEQLGRTHSLRESESTEGPTGHIRLRLRRIVAVIVSISEGNPNDWRK